ncbi:MAG TPA: NAD(P)-binding domain-containing protein [Candidatus Dormibacteraeota bacterium]|nr:NAD(P)-binding domain-containing protein [Candidatus Dormibacteraeota bacterium]
MTKCDVAVIGAGPYGLSIAAHLKARGVNFRIFGNPMRFWLTHMPKGMRLKSEGFASSLYDPDSTYTLEVYCKEKGIAYAKMGLPVPLEVFASYGLEFQRRFVPELENKLVNSLRQSTDGFRIRLEDGEVIDARRVVMAIGLTHYKYIPPMLATLPEEFVTHSSRHNTVDQFNGREVAVVGAGASALDLAALLHQAGARVQVIARKPVIRFHDPPEKLEPTFIDRLRTPVTGIGPGWKLFLCTNAPLLFRQMPQKFRLDKVRRILGPAPCWFTKEQVVGKIALNVGVTITEAKVLNGRVGLQLTDRAGAERMLVTDHVIAATGYKVDLRHLAFMDSDLQSGVQAVEHTPVLSSNFESSLPGLYFVGASAANTFGPLLRFAFGARFTARRLSRHLAKSADRKSILSEPKANVGVSDRDEVAVH